MLKNEITFKIIKWDSDDYHESLFLRNQVLRVPLGRTLSKEDIEGENNQIHIGGFINRRLVCCLTLCSRTNYTWQMRQVCVLPQMQGLGIGKQMIEYIEELAPQYQIRTIFLHGRKTAADFYLRCGYKICSEEYVSMNIPHLDFNKDL